MEALRQRIAAEQMGASLQQQMRSDRRRCQTERVQETQSRLKRPTLRTWTAEFLLRPGESRKGLYNCFKNRRIPQGRQRLLLQVVSHSYPCGSFLRKIDKSKSDRCRLCLVLRPGTAEDRLAKETVGHTPCQCAEQTVGRYRNDLMCEEYWGHKIGGQRFDDDDV